MAVTISFTFQNDADAQKTADAVAAKYGLPATKAGVKTHIIDHLQEVRREYKKEQRERAAAVADTDVPIT